MSPASYIYILESIGTQELILIGMIALIVFGPRKLPQMARKLGGMLSELRKVSNEFRETWEREASIDTPAVEDRNIDQAVPRGSARRELLPGNEESAASESRDFDGPEIREVSAEEYERLSVPASKEESAASMDPDPPSETSDEFVEDKRNWL